MRRLLLVTILLLMVGACSGSANNPGASPSSSPSASSGNKTAYVLTSKSLVVVDLNGGTGREILAPSGVSLDAVALSKDGKTAYLTGSLSTSGVEGIESVWLKLDLGSGKFAPTVVVEKDSVAGALSVIVLTPNGQRAILLSNGKDGKGTVVPIELSGNMVGNPIAVSTNARLVALALTPDGGSAVVISNEIVKSGIGRDGVTKVDLVNGRSTTTTAGPAGSHLSDIVVEADGVSVLVAYSTYNKKGLVETASGNGAVALLNLQTNVFGKAIEVSGSEPKLALSGDETRFMVVGQTAGGVAIARIANGQAGVALSAKGTFAASGFDKQATNAYLVGSGANGVSLSIVDLTSGVVGEGRALSVASGAKVEAVVLG